MKISNQYLKATFQPKGAELCSLINIETGQEHIWQADPSHWGRHAPVLFPFVGRLKNDQYLYNGKKYSMSQHGFARDQEFVVETQTQTAITFLLTYTEETLRDYPFKFELRLEYTLSDKSLITSYNVSNVGNDKMYFSIGGHPAFKCAMTLAGTRSDYHLLFENEEKADTHRLVDGVFNGKTESVIVGDRLPITDDLFDEDALVFKELNSESVTLVSKDRKWLTFHFGGFPYLGIWSKSRRSPFVCIEPWFGLADNQDHDGNIENKEGIQSLESQGTFGSTFSIQIH